MDEKELNPAEDPRTEHAPAEISVNEYGRTKDSAVVVDEADRTVLLTPDETVIFDKEPAIDIIPKNRPRYVYSGMWGRNEIATVTLGIFALLVVAIIYLFLVVPSNREVARHRSEVDALQGELLTAQARYGAITSSQSQVATLLGSEAQFENTYLRPASMGSNAIPRQLNSLIAAYGLVNTAGPDYQPLDTISVVKNTQSADEERGRDRFRSIFPGVYVSMTVEGSYQNLRRFIRELESGSEFVVISSIQLEPSDNTEGKQANVQEPAPRVAAPVIQQGPNLNQRMGIQQPYPQPADNLRSPADRGKMHGEVVSLHLEMAAYFRRPDFVPTVAQ
jgi:hypothetical protein